MLIWEVIRSVCKAGIPAGFGVYRYHGLHQPAVTLTYKADLDARVTLRWAKVSWKALQIVQPGWTEAGHADLVRVCMCVLIN